MKHTFTRPVLPKSDMLTDNKMRLYSKAKIVFAGMTRRLEAAYDPGGLALGVSVYAAADLAEDYHYILGVVNSMLLSYLFRLRFQAKHLAGGFLAINKGQLAQLPIRTINFSDPIDKQRHDHMVQLVEAMLALHKQLTDAKTPQEKHTIHRQIEATDKRIDRLVYELYNLSAEEIAIVEGSSAPGA